MSEQIIEKAEKEFYLMIKNFGSDPFRLSSHVPEVKKWAEYLLKKCPEADKEIVLLSVWLHDIGHYPFPTEIDHAIRSEERTKIFLEKEKYPQEKLNKVLHCVRSHRCKDVLPEIIEAKIIAFIDSASHITESMYFNMIKDNELKKSSFDVIGKMERDFRDLSFFPEIKKELSGLYNAWKSLINEYGKLDLK